MTSVLILAMALTMQSGRAKKAAPKAAPAKPFVSKEGRFTIAMPGRPKAQIQPVETPAGPIPAHVFLVETPLISYVVSYSDFPPLVLAKSDPVTTLKAAQQGIVTNLQGQVVSEGDIDLDGNPGREFEFELPQDSPIPGGLGRANYYLVKGRLYQVMALGVGPRVKSKVTDQFFKSFALNKDKELGTDKEEKTKDKEMTKEEKTKEKEKTKGEKTKGEKTKDKEMTKDQ